MAGTGERFLQAGYAMPKPLIRVNGKPIVQYIVEMFDRENDEFIFICNWRHLQHYKMEDYLKNIVPNCTVLSVPVNTHGPVYSVLNSSCLDLIKDDEEVIVSYCDNPFLLDYTKFKNWLSAYKPAGAIFSHTGFHPHRLSSTYMAYIKTDTNIDYNHVLEIKEKEPYTNNHWDEHASTGTYYFRKGSYIKKYFQELVDKKLCHTNGEYYVTLVYNLLIRDNLKIKVFPTDHVTVFGTPEEVQNFEAWQTILKGSQVQNYMDVLSCYRYWKNYNLKNKLCEENENKQP